MEDIYGHKRSFIIGVLLLSLASSTGGLAPSEIVLIVARVVQGLGAAMASPTGLSILVAAFPEGKERNRAYYLTSSQLLHESVYYEQQNSVLKN